MIVKDSKLHQLPYTVWPPELTPQQRQQLLQEKLVRVLAWQQQLEKHAIIKPDVECS